jgi:hypothetical protein
MVDFMIAKCYDCGNAFNVTTPTDAEKVACPVFKLDCSQCHRLTGNELTSVFENKYAIANFARGGT